MASSVILILLPIGLMASDVHTLDVLKKSSKCERITIPMCQDMPYNLTRMPNLLGHKDQSEAAIQVHEFIPLVEIGCSKNLKFFLCSLYAPMCTEQIDIPIPSCQSICEEVKSKCLPVLRQFQFNWPHMLNCSRLPVPKDGLCMEVPNVTDAKTHKHHVSSVLSTASSSSPSLKQSDTKTNNENEVKSLLNSIENIYPYLYPRRDDSFRPPVKPTVRFDSFDTNSHNSYSNDRQWKTGNKCYQDFVDIPIAGKRFNQSSRVCAPKCGKDVLFTRNDKNFVEIWICIWASICFMSTLFTVLTFWIDSQRFRYPEKPIIFLSMCFWISSIAYMIRIYAGSEFVSCDKSDAGETHITLEGLENSGCIIVFLLLYYFGMAAAMWWLMLTVTWYLAASKKWAPEAIEAKSSVFHLFSWATPAIFTIIVLTLRHVDGDELTGLCYVGQQDPNALLYFVIIPLSVFSGVGALVLLLGFVSMTGIRSDLRYDGHNTFKLDRLITRIGLFSSLYAVPAICVIGCHVYEYQMIFEWRNRAIERSRVCHETNTNCRLNESIPIKEIFILKIFMSMVLGISTGIWVWSNKTWNSWTHFCQSYFGRRQRRDFKSGQPHHSSHYIQVAAQQCLSQSSGGTSTLVAAQHNPNYNHISRHQLYRQSSYASLKSHSQRHSHRSHRKHRNDNSITRV